MNHATTREHIRDRTHVNFRATGLANDIEKCKADGPSVLELPRTPRSPLATVAKLVVLLVDRETSLVTIQRAASMADALDAKLHVVLAIPQGTAEQHPALAASHISELLALRPPRNGFELELVRGELAVRGTEIARAESASLVVVDARFGAKEACRLADEVGVPVLVARDAKANGVWIAATAMWHLEYPVLKVARELSRELGQDIVYFHNARPVLSYVPAPGSVRSYPESLELQVEAARTKRSRLERLANGAPNARGIVARDANTVGAILSVARERDADVIAVGHRRRSWLARWLGIGTTERVVARSRRSVLIVPLG